MWSFLNEKDAATSQALTDAHAESGTTPSTPMSKPTSSRALAPPAPKKLTAPGSFSGLRSPASASSIGAPSMASLRSPSMASKMRNPTVASAVGPAPPLPVTDAGLNAAIADISPHVDAAVGSDPAENDGEHTSNTPMALPDGEGSASAVAPDEAGKGETGGGTKKRVRWKGKGGGGVAVPQADDDDNDLSGGRLFGMLRRRRQERQEKRSESMSAPEEQGGSAASKAVSYFAATGQLKPGAARNPSAHLQELSIQQYLERHKTQRAHLRLQKWAAKLHLAKAERRAAEEREAAAAAAAAVRRRGSAGVGPGPGGRHSERLAALAQRAKLRRRGGGFDYDDSELRGGLLPGAELSDDDFVDELPQDNVYHQKYPGLSDFNNRRFTSKPVWGYTPDARSQWVPVTRPSNLDGSSGTGLAAEGGDGKSPSDPFSDVTASDREHGFDYVGGGMRKPSKDKDVSGGSAKSAFVAKMLAKSRANHYTDGRDMRTFGYFSAHPTLRAHLRSKFSKYVDGDDSESEEAPSDGEADFSQYEVRHHDDFLMPAGAQRTQALAALGLPANATANEVRSAYRRLALRLHPDKNGGVRTPEFHAVTAAKIALVGGRV